MGTVFPLTSSLLNRINKKFQEC